MFSFQSKDHLTEVLQISRLPYKAKELPFMCDIVVSVDQIRPTKMKIPEINLHKSSYTMNVSVSPGLIYNENLNHLII